MSGEVEGGSSGSNGMAVDPLAGERVLAFDTETTGISTSRSRIVQFALVGSDVDGSPMHIEHLVDPRCPIPIEASRVHGIYDGDVRGAPLFRDVADELHDAIEGAVLVGHNVRRFDMGMVEAEFMRLGRLPPKPKAVLDTLEAARRLKVGRPHNLGSLCQRHGIKLEKAHTAGADAAASLMLLWRFTVDHAHAFRRSIEDLEHWLIHGEGRRDAQALGRGLQDLAPLDAEGRIRQDEGRYILAFGRHRSRSLREVAAEDPAYLNWLLSPASGLAPEDIDELRAHLT